MATRRERIVLEVEDNASKKFAAAAIQAQLFGRSVDSIGSSSRKIGVDIDSFSGRLGVLVKAAAAIGPAISPIAGVATAGIGVLASQLGFATLGASSLIVAAQGVGDALEAVQKANLEPTAENIEAARVAMEGLAPAAQQFVTEFDRFRPVLSDIQKSAASGWFPGLTESLDSLAVVGPRVADIFYAIGDAGGRLAAEGAEALAGPEWAEFFSFLESEAPVALETLGRSVGNVGRAFAELWMAFNPLTTDFNDFLLESTQRFADWADGLAATDGFKEFLAYVRESGPQVAEAVGAIASAVVQIGQAAAPLGGPVLGAIEGFARAIAAIADSDVGVPLMGMVTALSALSLGAQATDKVMSGWLGRQKASLSGAATAFTGVISAQDRARMSADQLAASEKKRADAMRSGVGTAGRLGAALGGLGIAATGVADGFGLSNTASMALMGTLAGPWGAAVGAGVGLVMDLGAANEAAKADVADLTATFDAQTGAITANTTAKVAARLQDDGSLDRAAKLGIAADTVTQAVMGNADAQRELNAALEGFKPEQAALNADGTSDAFLTMGSSAEQTANQAKFLGEDVASASSWFASAAGDAEQLATAINGTGEAASGAARGSADFAERTAASADASRRAAEAAQQLSDALAGLSGWLDKRAALRGYDDAMRELSKSMRNGFTRADVENLDAVGRSIVQVATNLKAGKVRNNFIDESIASLREMAQGAGPRARAELQGLIAQLRKLGGTKAEPKVGANDKEFKGKVRDSNANLKRLDREKATPKIDADNKPAQGKIRDTNSDLQRLDRYKATPKIDVQSNAQSQAAAALRAMNSVKDRTVWLTIARRTTGAQIGNAMGGVTRAQGGPVYGPGTETSDSIPALLSNREFVVRAAATKKYGMGLLHRINSLQFAIGGEMRDGRAVRSGDTYARTRGPLGFEAFPSDGILSLDANARIAGMTMGRFDDRMNDSVKGEKERTKKRLEMLTEQRDATRDMVKSLKDSAKSLGDGVADMFRRNLWETQDRREFNWSDDAQAAIAQMSGEDQARYAEERYRIEQLMNAGSSPEDQIRQTIREANERLRLTRQLEQMGLRGPGLNELLGSTSNEQLRAYASDPSQAREFVRLFNQQEKVLSKLSGAVGDAAYGKQIAAQTKELREMGRDIRELKQEIAKQGKDGPERTGRAAGAAAGKAIKGELVDGGTGRARR